MIINPEQASKLKDLGFPQDMYYGVYYYAEESTCPIPFLGVSLVKNFYVAPSLEQVAKWLRDKKDLWIEISKGGYEKSAHCFLGDYIYEDATHIKEFNSYEEALSAGIDKAIEILKKNDND